MTPSITKSHCIDPRDKLFKDTIDFLIETTIQGPLLPYEDHEIVKIWLDSSKGDHKRLFLIISEVTHNYIEDKGQKPQTLKVLHKQVLSIIHHS